MELVYMWINKYGHLNDIGLNFGGENLFCVNKKEIGENSDYEIEITKINNPHHIKNFFNICKKKNRANIINITGIIGKNGAGKSTILEIIQKLGPSLNDALFIFKKKSQNGDKYYHTNLTNTNNKKIKFTGAEVIPIGREKLPHIIFYSNVFQTNNFKKHYRKNDKNFFDLSTMNYLYEEKHKTKSLETFLSEYSLEELNRQMDFVSNFYEIVTDDFDFKIPSVITILDSHPNLNKEDKIDKEKAEQLFDDINSNEVKNFFNKIDFSDCIHKNFKTNNIPSNLHGIMKSIFLQWLLNVLDSKEKMDNDLIKIIIKYSEDPKEFYTFLQSLKDKQLDNLLEIYDTLVKIAYNYQNFRTPFSYTITEDILGNFKEDKNNFIKLVKLLKKTNYTSNLLQFKWRDMSSGEVAILTLFSRFHSIKHEIISDNLLILLDEPDMYLNPSWVQEFINVFIEYLNKDLSGKTIQIILTSNKPICSSDLPAHNVIRLGKEGYDKDNLPLIEVKGNDGYQSFGANIYSLYKDGFFLNKNDGFIGTFARRKIQEVIEWLNDENNYEYKENIKKVIDIIGEPILRDKLRMMYKFKMDRNNDKNLSEK